MVSRVQVPDHPVDQAERATCRSLLRPAVERGMLQGSAGTQRSFSTEGKDVFLRNWKRPFKVFGKSVRYELDSKVGGKFSCPERRWLAQGIYLFSSFSKSAYA